MKPNKAQAIAMQFRFAPGQRVKRESDDEDAQNGFDNGFGHGLQEQQSEWNAEECRKHQPAYAADMHVTPILNHHDNSHGNGNQNGQRRGHLDR